jgi:hypothetical protein
MSTGFCPDHRTDPRFHWLCLADPGQAKRVKGAMNMQPHTIQFLLMLLGMLV